jgi:hypothetical protein
MVRSKEKVTEVPTPFFGFDGRLALEWRVMPALDVPR